MTIQADIMNIPARVNRGYSNEYQGGYKLGHRDARYAAAELAGAREAELVGALNACKTELERLAKWLDRLAAQSEQQVKQNRGRFDGLADACVHDAKNWKATAASIRAVLAKTESVKG